MSDLISRQDAIDAITDERIVANMDSVYDSEIHRCKRAMQRILASLPPVQPEQQWIPFNIRFLTEEEKEDHPEWDYILDCELPDDGQAILVTINVRGHERVQYDEFFIDDGCYLDSGYEIGTEAIAWMPLPKPWKGEKECLKTK